MSKQSLPKGHPLAQPTPAGVSPFDLADRIVAFRRGFSGGMTMVLDEDGNDDGDDPDDEVDPDATVKVGDKTFKVTQLQTIMAREKRQGARSGQTQLATDLGFESVDALKAALETAAPPAVPAGDAGDAATAEREKAAAAREAAAKAREAAAAKKERRAELRGALRDNGVAKDDLDDAYALLDRAVDADFEEDDLEIAVGELQGRPQPLGGDVGGGRIR